MSVSPMMKQYLDAKAACPDALLLFRMGDFYELFHEDAKTAARVLNLALTSRERGENAVPMAGFPYHQLESYLGKLIAAGFRAAICEQVEDPRQATGLVKREVVRIVTPGTVTDDGLLDPLSSNYLAAVLPGTTAGLAWVELSTGRFSAACVPAARLADELARVAPAELLLPPEALGAAELGCNGALLTRRPAWAFGAATAAAALAKHFGTAGLEGFGFGESDAPAIGAAGAVLDYLAETQKTSLAHIDCLLRYAPAELLQIDEAARRSLELVRTLREGRREGTLLAAIDRTATAMGARLLSEWLTNPLVEVTAIDQRLDAVAELVADAELTALLAATLRDVHDLERLLARATTGRASPRDLAQIGRTLALLPKLKARLTARGSALLNRLEEELDLCGELRSRLEAALVEDCPLSARDGGLIRQGYQAQLDQLRELATGGKQWIARYQAAEAARTGIGSLKVGFNKVFGYYIEITNVHAAKIPADYLRKQTVKNAERYITPELKQYEEQVLTADQRAQELEYELFVELRNLVAASARRLRATAAVLAQLDVLTGLAQLARERGYVRPQVVAEPLLRIVEGRHPVLDVLLPAGTLVPNDVVCGGDDGWILLVTGPNMAGKSTFIRQVALLTILAQMGSFVPAQVATIGVADRVFARVGASDELARGQSTFMVEMTESARILHGATPRSLVILDEIGRGTSTYDGLSLAWAMVEHLHDAVRCRTLFATHYHELTALSDELGGLRNFNVAVREWQDQLAFLHKIAPGPSDKSYGIHVARLAGVPRAVLEQAKQILGQLENADLGASGRARLAGRRRARREDVQMSLFAPPEHPLVDELRALDLDQLTPLAALAWIDVWQNKLDADARKSAE